MKNLSIDIFAASGNKTEVFLMSKANYNRIKAVLAEKKVTSKELAEHLKIHPQTVSTWCRNTKQPSLEMLFEVAKFLKVEVAVLLTKIEDLR